MSYLKGFKKAGVTDTHTIMRHPNGHEIHIAHKGLDKNAKKQMDGLPIRMAKGGMTYPVPKDRHYAEGTPGAPVAPEPPMAPMSLADARDPQSMGQVAPPSEPGQILQSQPGQNVLSTLQAQGGQDSNVTPTSPDVNAQQNADPMGLGALSTAQDKYGKMGMNAIGAAGAAQAGMDKQQAGIAQNAAYRMQDLSKRTMDEYRTIDDDSKAWMQSIADKQIDPDHYIHSKSTTGKIALGIGLFISGAGASMHGTANPALEMLQKNIDNDMRAQEANLGAKKSLLEANFKRFGNLKDAMEMTQVMMKDATLYRMQAAALKSGSPLAIAQSQLAQAKWGQENAIAKQSIAQRQAVTKMLSQPMNGAQGQQGQQGSHEAVAQRLEAMKMAGAIDDKQYTAALSELHDLQNHDAQSQTLLGDFDQMVNQKGRASTYLGYNTPAANNYKVHVMPYLKDAEGRINEQELQRTDSLIPSKLDAEDRIKQSRAGLIQFLHEKAPKSDTLRSLGMMPASKGPIREMKPKVK